MNEAYEKLLTDKKRLFVIHDDLQRRIITLEKKISFIDLERYLRCRQRSIR